MKGSLNGFIWAWTLKQQSVVLSSRAAIAWRLYVSCVSSWICLYIVTPAPFAAAHIAVAVSDVSAVFAVLHIEARVVVICEDNRNPAGFSSSAIVRSLVISETVLNLYISAQVVMDFMRSSRIIAGLIIWGIVRGWIRAGNVASCAAVKVSTAAKIAGKVSRVTRLILFFMSRTPASRAPINAGLNPLVSNMSNK